MAEITKEHRIVAKGAFWGLSGGMLSKIFGLVYTILLARLFSPADIGIFYLGLGIVYIIANFCDLGLNAALGRYLPYFIGRGELKKAGGIVSATYLFSGMLSVVFALSLFFLSGQISEVFLQPALVPVLTILSLFLLINPLFGINSSVLSSLLKIKETNILKNLWDLVKITATLLFFWIAGADSVIIAASFTLSYLLILALSFLYVRRASCENKLQLSLGNWEEKVSLLREALPIGLAIMLIAEISALAFYTDRIMLGWLLPPEVASESIGIYSLAVSMALVIPIFSGAISQIFFPLISKLYGKGDMEELKRISRTSARWVVFLLAPIAIVMVVFSGEILELFYGSAYMPGGVALAILAVGIFFRYLASVQGTILAAMRLVKIELVAASIGLLSNIVLNVALISQYGMDGAAIASATSLLITGAIVMYYCKKTIGSAFLGELVVPSIVAVILLALFFALKGHIWVAIEGVASLELMDDGLVALIAQKMLKGAALGVILAVIAGTYFAALVLVRGIKGEDWDVLLASMRKAKVPEKIVCGVESISKRFY